MGFIFLISLHLSSHLITFIAYSYIFPGPFACPKGLDQKTPKGGLSNPYASTSYFAEATKAEATTRLAARNFGYAYEDRGPLSHFIGYIVGIRGGVPPTADNRYA